MECKKIIILLLFLFIVGCTKMNSLNYNDVKIEWLNHASFKIYGENKIVYIDPYQIKEDFNDADLIFITHDHYDHCSSKDISKVSKEGTKIIATEKCASKLNGNLKTVKPNEKFIIENVNVETIPSYNLSEQYHLKSNDNVGFILGFGEIKIYHAGDTDKIPEMKEINVDIAILPVGGTYTMNSKEASEAAREINAKIFIPMHYGSIVGSESDAKMFKELVEEQGKNVEILK